MYILYGVYTQAIYKMPFFCPYDNCDYKIYLSNNILGKYKDTPLHTLSQNISSPTYKEFSINGCIVLEDVDQETLILLARCLVTDFNLELINFYLSDENYIRPIEDYFTSYDETPCSFEPNDKYKYLLSKLLVVFEKYFLLDDIYFGYEMINFTLGTRAADSALQRHFFIKRDEKYIRMSDCIGDLTRDLSPLKNQGCVTIPAIKIYRPLKSIIKKKV